eukprot:gene11803-24_t
MSASTDYKDRLFRGSSSLRSIRASPPVDEVASTVGHLPTVESMRIGSRDRKEPYSVMQLIQVTAKTWTDEASGQSMRWQQGQEEPYSVLQLLQVTAMTWTDEASGQTWLVVTHTDVTKAESFPKHVIDYMCGDSKEQGESYGSLARSHELVTLLFMDIVGFMTMSKSVASADVHKVETAGDCYIVSCGIMERDAKNGFVKVCTEHDASRSAQKVLSFAKDMLRISKMPVVIRIGLHTGSVVSGVIGTKLPKYSVFGDTMNTASRMESTANHGGIQVSADTFSLLQSAGNTDTWEPTGGIEVKGKGIMETFHIQMAEEVIDVEAIKRDLKDEIEKADDAVENP